MKTKKSNLKSAALLTGALVGGTALTFGAENTNSNDLLNYSSLGSGAELRTELLDLNRISSKAIESMNSETTVKFSELKCGEGKCGGEETKDESKEAEAATESKTDESKCGEGKCGEGKCGSEESEEDAKKEDK